MERNEKRRVTIEIYDADGDLRESLGGEYTFRQIRSMMKDIINNDGVPVIRQLGKHEAVEDYSDKEKNQGVMDGFLQDMASMLKQWGKPMPIVHGETQKIEPLAIPMVLEYEFDGIKFHAAGHPLDVHCANEALLKRVFEEND